MGRRLGALASLLTVPSFNGLIKAFVRTRCRPSVEQRVQYEAGSQRFEISAFVTSDYLVYFISDLDKQRNTQLMLALAPQAQGFIAKLEL